MRDERALNSRAVMKHFSVSLGNIAVAATDTDSDLIRKAEKYLPTALEKVGAVAAKEAWDTMQRGFSGSQLRVSFSASEKDKFISEATHEYVRDATSEDKRILKNQIIDQLKKDRDNKKKSVPK
jgi:hypothetical protein